MSNKETFTLKGKIIECLPNATFKVQLEGTENIVLGIISGKIRRHNINILLGDTVDIEMTPYDITKGRITFRYK
jgi:translation initiation factor IF-1